MKAQLSTVSERLTSGWRRSCGRRPRPSAARATAPTSRRRRRGSSAPSTTPGTGSPSASSRRAASRELDELGRRASGASRSATWPTSSPGRAAGVVEGPHRGAAGGAAAQRSRAPCSGSTGCPASVRADAREAYLDSVRGDIQLSSTEDKLAGELNIAWVHLGVEGSAAIVQLADGTYRVDLALDGEIGANIGCRRAPRATSASAAASPRATRSTPRPRPRRSSTGSTRSSRPDVDWSCLRRPRRR